MIRIFTFLLAIMFAGALNAQVYIWGGPGNANSEFDGGLNDWTVKSVSPNDSALWVWEADAVADRGAYKTNIVIESPSAANGAMVFDSDFYDNKGVQGNFGKGQSPATQVGELISPEFSCKDHATVSVGWNHHIRNYQSTCELQVTVDGGANWTSFPIEIPALNALNAANAKYIVDISSVAANQEKVQFKFVYNANYYYWIIDDVYVMETPKYDLKTTAFYYPFNAYSTPKHMINSDSLEFAADVANIGTSDVENYEVNASIVDNDGNDVYNFTTAAESLKAGDTTTVTFTDVVLPEDINFEEGNYRVRYNAIIKDAGNDEFNSTDNIDGARAVISTDVHNVAARINTGYSFGDNGDYTAFKVMRTGDLPEGFKYVAEDVTVGGAANGGEKIIADYTVLVLKLKNQVSEELDPLFESKSQGGPNDEPHPNLDYVGYAINSIANADNFDESTTELLDTDDETTIELEENTTYLVGVKWDFTNNPGGLIFTNAGTRINFYQNSNLVYASGDWGTIASNIAWSIGTTVKAVPVSNENFELAKDVVKVYPNPAVSYTNVQLEFNEPTSAVLILRDMKGSYITTKSVEKVTEAKVEFNVENLPTGTYSVEVTTDKGGSSVKTFVVTK